MAINRNNNTKKIKTGEEALIRIYKKLRPEITNSRSFYLMDYSLIIERYVVKLRRYKFNQKLSLATTE